jgi:hypothetical protein
MSITKWRLYGINNYSNITAHYYYGTYEKVKNHCIWANRNVLTWDYMVFEKVEEE